MSNQMIIEKQKQTTEILKEKDKDMWMTIVHETVNLKDPILLATQYLYLGL